MSQTEHCAMQIRVLSASARFDDPTDFRTEATAFFGRVDAAALEQALRGIPPGGARDATALFRSDDTRWRLLRPLPDTAPSGGFVLAPAQVQYLIQPPQGALYAALVLVGLPQTDGEPGPVTQPALTGILSRTAPTAAGQIFTIEPRQPDLCVVAPAEAAARVQGWLEKYLN